MTIREEKKKTLVDKYNKKSIMKYQTKLTIARLDIDMAGKAYC